MHEGPLYTGRLDENLRLARVRYPLLDVTVAAAPPAAAAVVAAAVPIRGSSSATRRLRPATVPTTRGRTRSTPGTPTPTTTAWSARPDRTREAPRRSGHDPVVPANALAQNPARSSGPWTPPGPEPPQPGGQQPAIRFGRSTKGNYPEAPVRVISTDNGPCASKGHPWSATMTSWTSTARW